MSKLSVDNLTSLSCAHTVTVDENVSRLTVLVVPRKDLDSILQDVLNLACDNFLTLLLHDEVRVILRHLFVDRCREANDRVTSSMAHVNSNQHSLHVVHLFRELQVEKVASHLAVHLLQHVGGL